MVHGFTDSGDSFVANKHDSVAFIIARGGYNVWIGNMRGSKYALGHTKLNAHSDSEYWYFSWFDQSRYDIPAFIEHIKSTTGATNMTVYSFSLGTKQMFYNFEVNQTYFKQNVNFFVATGPLTLIKEFSLGNIVTSYGYMLVNPLRFKLGWLQAHGPDGWFSVSLKFLSQYFLTIYSGIIKELSQGGTLEFDNLASLQVLQGHWPSGTNPHFFGHAMAEVR